jgi:hypothetical protein
MLLLDQAVIWTHLGTVAKASGSSQVVDMRAEVAVLSRNVVVQGDEESVKHMHGAQISVLGATADGATSLRLDSVQIRSGGQA